MSSLSLERMRLRAAISNAVQRGDDPTEARRDYKFQTAKEYLNDLLTSPPALTDDQVARLRALLPPVERE